MLYTQHCCIHCIAAYTVLQYRRHCCTDSCVNNSCGVQDKDYTAAAQLAFELKQPGRLLAVVNKACEAGPAKAHHILTNLVGNLSEEELKLCLEYIRDWNTNSRHCSVAQAMLQAILVKHQPQVTGCAVQLNSLQHLMQPWVALPFVSGAFDITSVTTMCHVHHVMTCADERLSCWFRLC